MFNLVMRRCSSCLQKSEELHVEFRMELFRVVPGEKRVGFNYKKVDFDWTTEKMSLWQKLLNIGTDGLRTIICWRRWTLLDWKHLSRDYNSGLEYML